MRSVVLVVAKHAAHRVPLRDSSVISRKRGEGERRGIIKVNKKYSTELHPDVDITRIRKQKQPEPKKTQHQEGVGGVLRTAAFLALLSDGWQFVAALEPTLPVASAIFLDALARLSTTIVLALPRVTRLGK